MDKQIKVKGAKPDFVLPSESFLSTHPLDAMLLTAKRTLRERWRQVVTEANVAHSYYLATLDDKISANQLKEAEKNKIYIIRQICIQKSIKKRLCGKTISLLKTIINTNLKSKI